MVVFIPFGFLLPLVLKKGKNFLLMFFNTFLFVLGIEVFQLFSAFGVFDVDDLFCNTLGTMIGYLLWRTLLGVKEEEDVSVFEEQKS